MKHTCSNLLLHCMDFRLGKPLSLYLANRGLLGDTDIVAMAGAAKNIVSGNGERELVLKQVDISKRLHGIQKVILVNHSDCGAYGGRAAFASSEEEFAQHVDDLKRSAIAVQEHYPDLRVETILAEIAPEGEVSFKEIGSFAAK